MFTIVNVHPFGQNVGNHAIHVALRQLLYEAFGRLVSIVEFPADGSAGELGSRGLTIQSVHEMNRIADGVIVGGGNLYENDALEVDSGALAALRPPLLLFSNSWGRIYDRFENLTERTDSMSHAKLAALLDRADLSLSRDSSTHSRAKSLNDKDQLGWCPTIALSRYQHLLPPLPHREDAGALISVRTPQLMNIPYRYQSKVPELVGHAIEALRSAGYRRVRILCNDSRDLDYATGFRFSHSADSVFASDVYEYLSLLSHADLVVSFRLHATLPSIAFGTPVVNISYDERAECLIRDLGVNEANLNLVQLGDSIYDELGGWINRGGYGPSHHADKLADWSSRVDFQIDSLRQFKSLVSDYVAQDSARVER